MIYVKENVKSRDIHVYISMENIQLAKGIEDSQSPEGHLCTLCSDPN